MSDWEVRYARQFAEQLAELPDATYDRVEGSVDILASEPWPRASVRPSL